MHLLQKRGSVYYISMVLIVALVAGVVLFKHSSLTALRSETENTLTGFVPADPPLETVIDVYAYQSTDSSTVVPHVRVELRNMADAVVATQQTNAEGYARFTVREGDILYFTSPDGYYNLDQIVGWGDPRCYIPRQYFILEDEEELVSRRIVDTATDRPPLQQILYGGVPHAALPCLPEQDLRCIDYDGGNRFISGRVDGLVDRLNDIPYYTANYDYCTEEYLGAQTDTGGYVVEMMCRNNKPLANHTGRCPDGYSCAYGACMQNMTEIIEEVSDNACEELCVYTVNNQQVVLQSGVEKTVADTLTMSFNGLTSYREDNRLCKTTVYSNTRYYMLLNEYVYLPDDTSSWHKITMSGVSQMNGNPACIFTIDGTQQITIPLEHGGPGVYYSPTGIWITVHGVSSSVPLCYVDINPDIALDEDSSVTTEITERSRGVILSVRNYSISHAEAVRVNCPEEPTPIDASNSCVASGYKCTSAIRGCGHYAEYNNLSCGIGGSTVMCCQDVPRCGDGVCFSHTLDGYGETVESCPDDCGRATPCRDSDGGWNYNTKGSSSGSLYSTGRNTAATDYCHEVGQDIQPVHEGPLLTEFACRDGREGLLYFRYDVVCPYGCRDGACIQQLPPDQQSLQPPRTVINVTIEEEGSEQATHCRDSDGDEPEISGTVTSRSGGTTEQYNDECITTEYMWEYTCSDGRWQNNCYKCTVCDQGKCLYGYKHDNPQVCEREEELRG